MLPPRVSARISGRTDWGCSKLLTRSDDLPQVARPRIGALCRGQGGRPTARLPVSAPAAFPGLLLEAFVAGGTTDVSASRALLTVTLYLVIAGTIAGTVFARRDVTG
jgi:hypothetical protein